VSEHQQLGLGVHRGALEARGDEGEPDLHPSVCRLDHAEAGAADDPAAS